MRSCAYKKLNDETSLRGTTCRARFGQAPGDTRGARSIGSAASERLSNQCSSTTRRVVLTDSIGTYHTVVPRSQGLKRNAHDHLISEDDLGCILAPCGGTGPLTMTRATWRESWLVVPLRLAHHLVLSAIAVHAYISVHRCERKILHTYTMRSVKIGHALARVDHGSIPQRCLGDRCVLCNKEDMIYTA
jgi:hypothetical protein